MELTKSIGVVSGVGTGLGSPRGGTGLIRIATKFNSWQRYYTQAMPYATVAFATLLVLIFHSMFGFNGGLEALYILPIWLSIRLIGPTKSLISVIVISLILTLARPQLTGVSFGAVLAGLGIRLIGFSTVGVLVAWFESSYSRAKGLAYRDPLTGLLNRHGLADFGERLFGKRNDQAVVVMLDCDGFKQVNDRYGHKAGDHILRMLARILEHETRSTDALVRMGGDEFALVLESASAEDAHIVLERVQHHFELSVADAGYECSISFGIAQHQGEEELDDVIAKADAAMYDNKNAKKNRTYVC